MLEMIRGKVSILALAMAIAMALLTVAPLAHAEGSGSAGTSVAPPVTDVTANPGETINKTLEVTNNGNSSQGYAFSAANLIAAGDNGEASYTGADAGDLASWISLSPSSVTLGAGESIDLKVSIVVPANAPAGGHYATIFARSSASSAVTGSGSSVGTMVGANFLLKVTGNVIENAQISSFSMTDSSFDVGDSASFEVRVANMGNTHIAPTGYIELFRGDQKVDQVALNDAGGNVLPNSTRRFEATSNAMYLPGSYNAKVTLTYAGGKVLTTDSAIDFVVRGEYSVLVLVSIVLAVLVGALALALLVKRQKVRV